MYTIRADILRDHLIIIYEREGAHTILTSDVTNGILNNEGVNRLKFCKSGLLTILPTVFVVGLNFYHDCCKQHNHVYSFANLNRKLHINAINNET